MVNNIRNTVLQVMIDISFVAFVFATIPYCNLQFSTNKIVNKSTLFNYRECQNAQDSVKISVSLITISEQKVEKFLSLELTDYSGRDFIH
jgi:hypothetical protein